VDVVRKGYSVIKRISLLVTAALLVATMAMAGLAGPAFAKISPPECQNPSGATPGGQQPTCKTQNEKFTQTCAENPAE
jgi:hypothetical protein